MILDILDLQGWRNDRQHRFLLPLFFLFFLYDILTVYRREIGKRVVLFPTVEGFLRPILVSRLEIGAIRNLLRLVGMDRAQIVHCLGVYTTAILI